MHDNIDFHTSKIVDGYRKAFIDSGYESDPEYSPSLITNSNGKKVLTVLEREMKNCDEMCISVAFITRGGITPLLGTLKELEAQGIKGKILTTDYLMFSDPDALNTLDNLGNIELRMFKTAEGKRGFHTKGYLFHNKSDLRIIVGSSNLTQDAITKNYEWNTKIVSTVKGEFARDIEKEFNDLWETSVCYGEYKEEYSANYKEKEADRRTLGRICRNLVSGYSKVLEPNSMQLYFIHNIDELVKTGEKRALLISATGTGKTYASAFAVRHLFLNSFTQGKVLFISHREQINKQAKASYEHVFGKGVHMELLSGSHKDMAKAVNADFLFSTVQMISKDEILKKYFSPEDFSVIILDECHRTGAESYQKIIDYFCPKLLLGMSASPERTDSFDVFSLFDHNIACEIRLQQALENDLLCPFHYFGITDLEIDGNADEVSKFRLLTSDRRVNHIISRAEYYGFSGERVRGLVFCSSKNEARGLSRRFNETGKYETVALCGEDSQEVREDSISRLAGHSVKNKLDYIFTVDIFNEGVDIPEINQVIMLRPTESPVVFVQQLGRGLRKSEGKEYVVILDFIGNYNNNYMIPIALSGDRTGNKDNIRRSLMEGNNFIKGASTIYFDEISRKRIYTSIDNARLNRSQLLKQDYMNLKYKLGRIPDLSDFDEYGELDPLRIINYCGSYHAFLKRYESDYNVVLDDVQEEMLKFVSMKFASGKRPHELALLRILIRDSGKDPLAEWEKTMNSDYHINVDDLVRMNVTNVLTNRFFGIGAARDSFKNCIFLTETRTGMFEISDCFRSALKTEQFRNEFSNVISFGLGRYHRDYSSHEKGTSFVLYKKYTYDDVCRLLNWKENQVATNIGGYKYDRLTKTYPVFINYHKEDDISDTTKYEDRFVNPSSLIAISKSRRNLYSEDVRTALDSVRLGVRMELFVRKNKDDQESKEFYYLGQIIPSGHAELFKMPNTDATAVEIGYRLLKPVEAGLYEYITETEL